MNKFISHPDYPNLNLEGNGFYISYNATDYWVYGCITTALVVGQMEKFYILKGDFRDEYLKLVDKGFEACLNFFKENIDKAHEYSDKLPCDKLP